MEGVMYVKCASCVGLVIQRNKSDISCTSVEQSLFKQIVTEDKIFPSSLVKKLLYLCTIGESSISV